MAGLCERLPVNIKFLPHAKHLNGRKILLGDNFSSHFTDEVISLCKENGIAFICLPKNYTHITQPLEAGFFRPFKMAWKRVLINWKKVHPALISIDKRNFPQLLKETLTDMDKITDKNKELGAVKRNLIASFKAVGIYPCNKDQVLNKLPLEDLLAEDVNHVLVKYLKEKRYTNIPSRRNIKRTKLCVEPGKSVTAQEEQSSGSDEEEDEFVGDISDENNTDDETDEKNKQETEYLDVRKEDIKNGTLLVVKILRGSRKKEIYRFVAVVYEINGEEIEMVGLKSTNAKKIDFILQRKDKFIINTSDIIAILPQPVVSGNSSDDRNIYHFAKPIDVKES